VADKEENLESVRETQEVPAEVEPQQSGIMHMEAMLSDLENKKTVDYNQAADSNSVYENAQGPTNPFVKFFQDFKFPKIRVRWESGRKRNVQLAGIAAAMLLLMTFATTLSTNTGITGFVIGEPTEYTYDYPEEYTANTQTTLGFQGILGLSITGTLEGSGAVVKINTGNRDYLVANLTGTAGTTYTLTTDKRDYALGETVNVILTPEATLKSIYASQGENNDLLNDTAYTPSAPGNYTIFALITTANDILRLEVQVTVINISENETLPAEPREAEIATAEDSGSQNVFTNLCIDSCIFQEESSNPVLIVELEEGSKLQLSSITTVEEREDLPPTQTKTFQSVTLQTGSSVNLQLQDYFSDPEGTALSFDVTLINEVATDLIGDSLTLTGNVPGTYVAHAYASDGLNLITGNDFTITVQDGETIPAPTEEVNSTNETEMTPTTPPTLPENSTFTDCNDPNPNKRPLSCIEGNEGAYFDAKKIYLEDAGKNKLGRITAFGNLVIRGELIQSATNQPNQNDFRISKPTADFTGAINMAWIDQETGDLYLRGVLHEEQLDLVPPVNNAFLMQNTKGTTLGYFDRDTGSLYLRGNLITGKPDLE